MNKPLDAKDMQAGQNPGLREALHQALDPAPVPAQPKPFPASDRQESFVRVASLEFGPEAEARLESQRQSLTPEQYAARQEIGAKLTRDFYRDFTEMQMAFNIPVEHRISLQVAKDAARFQAIFDLGVRVYQTERARIATETGKAPLDIKLDGKTFGELFQRRDPKLFKMMSEGATLDFIPNTSLNQRRTAKDVTSVQEELVVVRDDVRTAPAAPSRGSDEVVEEELVALAPATGALRRTPDLRSGGFETLVSGDRADVTPLPEAPPAAAPFSWKLVIIPVVALSVVLGGMLLLKKYGGSNQGTSNSSAPAETKRNARPVAPLPPGPNPHGTALPADTDSPEDSSADPAPTNAVPANPVPTNAAPVETQPVIKLPTNPQTYPPPGPVNPPNQVPPSTQSGGFKPPKWN